MNTLSFISRESAVDDKAIGVIEGRDVSASVGDTRAGPVDLIVLAAVGTGPHTGGNGVAGVPVHWEVGAGVVTNTLLLDSVLGQTGILVDTNSRALLTVGRLL